MNNENSNNAISGFTGTFPEVILLLTTILYRITLFVLLLILLTLIILFGLQFAPPEVVSAPVMVTIHSYCDPAINVVAGWVGMKWPTPSAPSYLPLGLCFVIFILWITIDHTYAALNDPARRMLRESRKKKNRKDLNATILTPPAEQHTASSMPTVPMPKAPTIPFGNQDKFQTYPEAGVQRIGRYEIIEALGQGAMGVVYKAKDPQIGRIVAIKSISAAVPTAPEFKIYKQRFMQEAKAAGQMVHPGIVTIHDLTEDRAGHPAMVMEFVEGSTLENIMSEERPPFKRCMNLLAQAARALDYAHKRGVIHRDIKPANLLVTKHDILKIADFGVAKLEGSSLTISGQLLGTPAFMSPEQFTGSAVDGRSDLFSLGAILYWMCTGELPFPGDSITAIGVKVMQLEPLSVLKLNPTLPPDIDKVMKRCLAKRPDDRYETAADLAADLEALSSGSPLPSESKKA